MSRCNYCSLKELKKRYSIKKLICLPKGGWPTYYLLDTEPAKGQAEPLEYKSRPIRFLASFMEVSDHCVC